GHGVAHVLAPEAARPCRDDGNLSGQVLVDHAHTLSNAGTLEKVPCSGCRSLDDARAAPVSGSRLDRTSRPPSWAGPLCWAGPLSWAGRLSLPRPRRAGRLVRAGS